MSEEKGKKAGAISKFKQQYGQIGSGKPSERLDDQESKSPTIETSEPSAIEAPKLPDSQASNYQTIQPSQSLDRGEPSMPTLPTVERPSAQKARSKQQRDKLTVYIEPELNDWVRQQVIIEKRRRGHHVEISDIINEALQKMKDHQ